MWVPSNIYIHNVHITYLDDELGFEQFCFIDDLEMKIKNMKNSIIEFIQWKYVIHKKWDIFIPSSEEHKYYPNIYSFYVTTIFSMITNE